MRRSRPRRRRRAAAAMTVPRCSSPSPARTPPVIASVSLGTMGTSASSAAIPRITAYDQGVESSSTSASVIVAGYVRRSRAGVLPAQLARDCVQNGLDCGFGLTGQNDCAHSATIPWESRVHTPGPRRVEGELYARAPTWSASPRGSINGSLRTREGTRSVCGDRLLDRECGDKQRRDPLHEKEELIGSLLGTLRAVCGSPWRRLVSGRGAAPSRATSTRWTSTVNKGRVEPLAAGANARRGCANEKDD